MDDQRFDALTKRLGKRMGRRRLLISATASGMAVAIGQLDGADAARRGYSGPSAPEQNGPDHFCYDGCCMECGGDDYRRARLHSRFTYCYNLKEFCEGHDQGCCNFCIGWAGDSYATCRAVP